MPMAIPAAGKATSTTPVKGPAMPAMQHQGTLGTPPPMSKDCAAMCKKN
jgi:hypothetical protein